MKTKEQIEELENKIKQIIRILKITVENQGNLFKILKNGRNKTFKFG